MASQNPPVINIAHTFYCALPSMTTPGSYQVNPTLAAGDVKVSIDGAALANLGTLPVVTPAGSIWVKVVLTAGEMNGDNIQIQFIDQTATKEWGDCAYLIQTQAAAIYATAAALATAQADLDDIQTRLPAALVSGRMDSSVGAMAANVMTAAAAAADLTTELQAGLATSASIVTLQADTDDIQLRLPAALIGGRIDSTVGAMQANVMTAAAAAADLTTELQAGLATAAALATVQADTDNIQTRIPAALVGGRMDSDVAVIQANVVTASALAADAVTEIQSGLGTSANQTTINNNVLAVGTAVAGVQSDTDNIQTRIPAALVGGRIDASVGAVEANAITAAGVAADASAKLADRLLGRSIQGGADGGRTVTDSLRPSRNKSEIVAGTLTVYQEDDATPAWTAAVTTAAGNPITAIDPA